MIRLSANLSKKVPMPDVDFSSQQYGAAMEIEVSDAADAQEITGKLKEIYSLLEGSIDSQIATASNTPSPQHQQPKRSFLRGAPSAKPDRQPSNGNGESRRNGHSSPAQVKAIFAIAKDRGLSRDDLGQLLKGEFNADTPEELSVKDASDLIGMLQKMGATR